MSKQRILVTFWVTPEAIAGFKDEFEIVYPEEKITGRFEIAQTKAMLKDFDACLVQTEPFTEDVIDAGLAGKLKAIGRSGVGCDSVKYEYAGSKGVAVINTPVAVTEPTAELAISIMLASCRRICVLDKQIRENGKCMPQPSFDGKSQGAFGKVMGIIGLGRIGKAVARKAKGLGMKIVYADMFPAPAEVEKELGAIRLSTDDVFKVADFVSLHCFLDDNSKHLINERTLGLMKPGAYLINAARGGLMDEAALCTALEQGKIRGAALDVFEFEPKVSERLCKLENVVLAPHVGTCTFDARVEMARESLQGITEFLKTGNTTNIFNRKWLVKK